MTRLRLICLASFWAVLVTCSDEAEPPLAPPPPPDPGPPELVVSPDSLCFELTPATPPGMTILEETLEISNAGGDTLRWHISENAPWLNVSADSGYVTTDPASVVVSADLGMIPDGETRETDIIVSAGTQADTVHAVARNGVVRRICASASSLEFFDPTQAGPKTLFVRACGTVPMRWTATSTRPWVQVSPDSGTSTGEWDSVTVTVDWDQLGGDFTWTSVVRLESSDGNAIDVQVEATIEQPCLSVDRTGFYLRESDNPGPANFMVSNCGHGPPVDWTVRSDESYVSFSRTSGTSYGHWDSVYVYIDWSIDWTLEEDLFASIIVEGAGDTIAVPMVLHPNCAVRILEPAAGTTWTAGDIETILWGEAMAGYHVDIHLYKGEQFVMDLGSGPADPNIPNTGSLQWPVTTNGFPAGSDYRFRISADVVPNCWSWSEDFTITVP